MMKDASAQLCTASKCTSKQDLAKRKKVGGINHTGVWKRPFHRWTLAQHSARSAAEM
jgi:hypothetical protein